MKKVQAVLVVAALCLVALSFIPVFYNAAYEPFFAFRTMDVAMNVGLPGVLLALWAQFYIGLTLCILLRRLHVVFGLLLFPATYLCILLLQVVLGYLGDIEFFISKHCA